MIDRSLFFKDIPGNAKRLIPALGIFLLILFGSMAATYGIGVTVKYATEHVNV